MSRPPLRHRCAQCGASCQGLRARLAPDEHARIEAHAAQLGIERPIAGAHLRQNWGRCVFWDQGCRLHAEIGVDAKPVVCRQFPFVYDSTYVGLDPACFHADPDPDGAPARESSTPLPPSASIDWEDLAPGVKVAERLEALPLVAVLEGPRLGPMTRALLQPLIGASPRAPAPGDRPALERRIHTVQHFGLAPEPDRDLLLVGGAQLVVGAQLAPGTGFAAWVRLLRTGMA